MMTSKLLVCVIKPWLGGGGLYTAGRSESLAGETPKKKDRAH